jgi:hypothetical protein
VYKVDTEGKQIVKLVPKTFAELHLLERFDIQEWIANSPEILGEDLLIIAKELKLPSRIRIDRLAVDSKGNLVVIELKRDESDTAVEWQAIKYASYCSSFLPEDIFSYYAQYLESDVDDAQRRIEEFLDEELDRLNQDQRIVLVAREFHPDVASAVLWLRDYEVDIKCVRFSPYVDAQNDLFITPDIIIPLPEAKDYVERKEAKRREQKQTVATISSFSLEKGEFDVAVLEQKLRATLARQSDLTPRFVRFLEILLSEDRVFGREEVKQRLFESGVGFNFSQTGRYLSNISQFLTKKSNPHLRQVIDFTSGGPAGETKDNYRLLPDYRELVRNLVSQWNAESDATPAEPLALSPTNEGI